MPARAALLATLVAAIWGFNFVVMKWGVAHVPPLLLLALRFALAAVPAICFVARPAVPWPAIVGYGLIFGVAKFVVLFAAFRNGMTAGVGSGLLQSQVFFTVALALLLDGERPAPHQVAALAVAVLGLAVIGWGSAYGEIGLAAFVMVLAAGLCWAAANMISRRAGKFDALSFVVWTSAVAAMPLLALSLAIEGPAAVLAALRDATPLTLGAALYLAWPVTLLALAIWSRLLAHYPAAAIAPYALLVPVFGLSCAALVLGERPSASSLVGGAVIVAALALNTLGGRIVKRSAPT